MPCTAEEASSSVQFFYRGKPMKILQPDLSGTRIRLEKEEAYAYLLRHKKEEEDVTGVHFVGLFLDEESFGAMTFKECVLASCRMMECKLEGGSWIKNEWIACDLSGSRMSEGYFHRNRFRDCKMMGTDLCQGNFQEMILEECNLGYSNWDQGRFKNLLYRACDCERTFFSDGRMKNVYWEECRLAGVNFFRTPLRGMDFTKCELGPVTVSDTFAELRGAKVTAMQALSLSRLLGIEIASE